MKRLTAILWNPTILTVALFMPVISLQTGCATIVKGTTQAIPVASDPAGADVLADGNKIGNTPVNVKLARKRNHLVTITKQGYEVENIAVTRSVGGAVAGNILAGGLIGWGVLVMPIS